MFPFTSLVVGDWLQDLLVDPSTRDNTDIQHKLVAIGSRTTESANKFIEKLKALPEPYAWGVKNGVMDEIKGYGSYDEVYNASVSSTPPLIVKLMMRMWMQFILEHPITSITRMQREH
jgi:hypothetical protein